MIDRHHVLFDSNAWSQRIESVYLRSTESLVPRMERSLHNELHKECPIVPVLGFHALQRVIRTFQPLGETLEDIDLLQMSIDKATRHPKTHPLERSLAQLTIHSIDLQKPFLQEAVSSRKMIA